ncbi:MAG: endolytic transglycosylase MltG [Parafannyhessea umbonata]|jgi:UPF0755 protein|nr:endolytic transglycosylase MltG [Parafannyhessea umbonata]MCI6681511.1 endolytic transglycosylase MltG [Parafannyhessea umbonata]MCI7217976.1 endolytic transglycosylase MltG [Parafannyhessea umbonata]MDD6359827.1 endolytic transglycosylase MltG [Parafannyhessea umbonata]MDY4015305.1 endolytic transglycosylase MltG [Parafannyhessea umbonata]
MSESSGRRGAHFARGNADGTRAAQGPRKGGQAERGARPQQARRGGQRPQDGRPAARKATAPGKRQPISRTGAMQMQSANGSDHMSSRTARMTQRARSGHSHKKPEPQGRRGKLKFLPFVLVAVAVVAAIGFVVVPRFLGAGHEGKTVEAGKTVTVNIPEGSGGSAIAQKLYDAGVISDKEAFATEVKRQEADSKLKSGTYVFVTGGDVAEVVSRLVTGPNSNKGTVTVAEGLTVKKTAKVVSESLGISTEDFLAQAKASNYSAQYAFLANAQNDSLEGFLYPTKYDFGSEKNVTADTVIKAMLDKYQSEVASLDFASAEATIKSQYGVTMSDYDIIKLASIIEREAISEDDRGKVASVFYNRLKAGMPLQSDATMSYVTGGEVTADDLKTQSPYNTYLNKGLPPTPICTPSLASIKAALAPDTTDYMYFLIIEKGDYSNHTFSTTYEDHQKAIEKAKADQAG